MSICKNQIDREVLPKWLRKILPHELGVHYFRVAFAQAVIGEINDALEYLDRAVDNGWLFNDFLMSCIDRWIVIHVRNRNKCFIKICDAVVKVANYETLQKI